MLRTALSLLLFALICFVQNAAFTWSSRSRNSGDPGYHRKAAWCSNGVYWITNLGLTVFIIHWQHSLRLLILTFVIYTLSTTEGSVLMMRALLKREKGRQQVGAR